jgi:hypothetical protein
MMRCQNLAMAWKVKLARALASAGHTDQSRLAEIAAPLMGRASLSKEAVRQWFDESTTTQPRYEVLFAFSRLAGVSVDWLLNDELPDFPIVYADWAAAASAPRTPQVAKVTSQRRTTELKKALNRKAKGHKKRGVGRKSPDLEPLPESGSE